MKKMMLLMLLPMWAHANICDQYFQKMGTKVNNYDTTEWLGATYKSFWCDMDFATNRPSNSGDFAYYKNDFGLSDISFTPMSLYHKFTIGLKGALSSFEDGDRIGIFQVRSENPVDQRLLNLSLFKRVEPGNPLLGNNDVEYWELKLVWFKPTANGVEKTATFINLGHSLSSVKFYYLWHAQEDDFLEINGTRYYSPYQLELADMPAINKMGFINANTLLDDLDALPFLEVIPNVH